MKLLGISNQGLAVIATLVCVLWGVIFMERAMNERAERYYHELKESMPTVPVSAPTQDPSLHPSVS